MIIQFHQVQKQYPGNDFYLGDLDFGIDEGEFVFLIGPSGSGKTSVIRLLTREERPSSGRIYFDDYDITKMSRNNVYRLRRQIGVIFQDYKLIPDKNAFENVAFAMEAAGRTDKEIKETVPYVLDIVGLSERSKAFPDQLSGGEKQRVAIARAVANNPRVLIADEPTGNLDPASSWDIVQILSKINNWGTTVLMSTHGTDIVNALNKRVIQMDSGRIVRDDRKGTYEITSARMPVPEAAVGEEPMEPAAKEKSGTFKVKIKTHPAEQPERSSGLFGLSWLGFGKHKDDGPLVDERGNVRAEEFEAIAVEDILAEDTEKILADAERTPLEDLDLEPPVIADLRSAGYQSVEDIIEAGPDKLKADIMIDPDEVVRIAQALEKFVSGEEEKIERMKEKERQRTPHHEKKDKVEEKKIADEDMKAPSKKSASSSSAKRVKLNLVSGK